MALVTKMQSDITGVEAAEADFIQLVVRQHPAIKEPKALDVLPDEIASLKEADNLVIVDVKNGAEVKQIVIPIDEFRELVSDDVVKNARHTRGRRPGS
jgi:hypothetical protein